MPDSNEPSLVTFNRRGRMTAAPSRYSRSFIEFAAGTGAPVLDVGAAFGVASIPALEAGATVIANDLDVRHLEELQRRIRPQDRHRLTLLPGRFPDELDVEDRSLGAIHAANLLNFLRGPEIVRGAAAMHRWIRDGGKVFIVCATPYAANIQAVIPEFERRKRAGEPWPGEIERIQDFSSHETVQELQPFLHLLDADILKSVFEEAGFVVEKAEMFMREGLPPYLVYDGRENAGLIARR